MNLNNIENIFYWTDNNGAVYLPGDTALTYRTKSDLPRFVAAVYSALNTDSGVSERVVPLKATAVCCWMYSTIRTGYRRFSLISTVRFQTKSS